MKHKRNLIITGLTIIGLTATLFAINTNLDTEKKACKHASGEVCDKDSMKNGNCKHDKKHDGKSCDMHEEKMASSETCAMNGEKKACCKKKEKTA